MKHNLSKLTETYKKYEDSIYETNINEGARRKMTIGKKDTIIGSFNSADISLIARKSGTSKSQAQYGVYYDLFVYEHLDGTATTVARHFSSEEIPTFLKEFNWRRKAQMAGGFTLDQSAIAKLTEKEPGGQDESLDEAEPIQGSSDDIMLLRKLGYSKERIGRMDRQESETILMNKMPANKLGEGKYSDLYYEDDDENTCDTCQGTGIGQMGDPDTSKCTSCAGRGYHLPDDERDPDRAYDERRDRELEDERFDDLPSFPESVDLKVKEDAFWTEVNENLFTKASMSFGKKFLPNDDEPIDRGAESDDWPDEEEDIDEGFPRSSMYSNMDTAIGSKDIDSEPPDMYNTRYEDVIFLQGHEAEEAMHKIHNEGPEAALEYLTQWHYPGEHETRDEKPHGSSDQIFADGGYFMFWNSGLPYVGLTYDTQSDEGIDDRDIGDGGIHRMT